MPCKDITDTLEILIDHDERVKDYSLHKRTCGGAVGEDQLIGKWLIGRPVAEVLATSLNDFQGLLKTRSDIKEFLAIKHFMVVQAGLAVLLGQQPGRVGDFCTLESVEGDAEGTKATLHVQVEAVVDEIKACNKCCGSKGEGSMKTFTV